MIKFIKKYKRFIIIYWVIILSLFFISIFPDFSNREDLILHGLSNMERTIHYGIGTFLLFILFILGRENPKWFGLN